MTLLFLLCGTHWDKRIQTGEWVAAHPDGPRELSTGPLQLPKLFWPPSEVFPSCWLSLAHSSLPPKHPFSSARSLDPPTQPAPGLRGWGASRSVPTAGAFLYHPALHSKPAFFVYKVLEPGKRPCSYAEWNQTAGCFLASGFVYHIPPCPQALLFICGVLGSPNSAYFRAGEIWQPASMLRGPKRGQTKKNPQVHSQPQQGLDQDAKTCWPHLQEEMGKETVQDWNTEMEVI